MSGFLKKPLFQVIDGLPCPMFPLDCVREALGYQPKPDDVFLVTYPKCGTTWMQTVALNIFRKGQVLEDPGDFHRFCPFIDARGLRDIQEMPRPGIIKTHFPRTRMPYSPEAKYIYVLRNPKDCCVSMYHHIKGAYPEDYSGATFDDFFEIFMAGEVQYGDYFDHLMSWYPSLKDANVFFTTYEGMKKDLRDIILKLSSFLGQKYVEAIERENSVLDNILRFSSFEYMKNSNIDFNRPKPRREERQSSEEDEDVSKPRKSVGNFHVRKGIVGDWVNYFSEEQSERLNRKFVERTKGTEIFEIYRDCMGL